MDGFITKRTAETMRIFRPRDKIVVVNNKYRNGGLKFIELKKTEETDEETLCVNIYKKLKEGLKVYGFISSKKSIKFIEKWINEKGGFKIKTYHGDTDRKDKVVDNVNEDWIKYDCILTTSTITIGIDFKPKTPYFDCSFFYGNDNSCCVRDTLQGLYRVRDLKSKEVYYILKEKLKSMSLSYKTNKLDFNDTFEKCIELMKQEKSLEEMNEIVSENKTRDWIIDILSWNVLEKNINKSFYKETFEYFCKIQNYTIEECKEEQQKTKSISSDRKPNSIIKLIDNDKCRELEEKGEDRTLEESEELRKYHFNRRFDICDSDFFYKRYNDKNMFYFDMLINDNHTINDIEKLIVGDITSKKLNQQKLKSIKVKKFLNIINKDKKDIYTEPIIFKESDIKEFLVSEKLNMKRFKSQFSRSLFKIRNHKTNRTDKTKTELVFSNDIEKNCNKDMIEYITSKERREENNYSESHTIKGDIHSEILKKEYYNEIVNVMKSYKQQPKKTDKLKECLIK